MIRFSWPFFQARFRDEALGKFGEGQVEDSLLAIPVEHLLLKRCLVQLADALFTDTGFTRFLGQIFDPLAKIGLAFRLGCVDGSFGRAAGAGEVLAVCAFDTAVEASRAAVMMEATNFIGNSHSFCREQQVPSKDC
ncbi:hypothetical protein HED55_01590 [Ochrobactrum haematophilum]|uniref:Uncharacterized protein n=1 Tax=Brucella haematophila TaxID=419474 RepID=A0ABX1DLM3_9HYPH|nr:hypothetical protein [Brucella haematophila]